MNPFSCPRESDTIRAAWSGAWPEGCGDDLRQHLRACPVCREAVQLAGAFREEREASIHEARVPGSGLVWWRAQLHARREAARTAERPVAMAQALAIVGALVAVVAVSWAMLPSVRTFFGGLTTGLAARADLFSSLPSPTGAFSGLSTMGLLAQPGILMVVAATLVLAPVAVYLAVAKDN